MAFNSVGYDGTINEREWAELAANIGAAEYGVKEADDLKVKAVAGQPLMVSINPGTAWGRGVMDTATTNTTITCETIAAGSRWDLIALRRDWQPEAGGPSEIVAVKGSATKAIPAARKQTPGVQDDQPLALVRWTAGSTQPTQIIDLRVWAGNGGVVAMDDLVLTYLNHPGASIIINGTEWNCAVGENDTVSWVKTSELGKIPLLGFGNPLAGTKPDPGTNFFIQAGTTVNTYDAGGYARITWPKPFPNGLLSVQAIDGDDWATGGSHIISSAGSIWGNEGYGTRTSWVYAGRSQPASSDGTGSLRISRAGMAGKLHRINWVAIGW